MVKTNPTSEEDSLRLNERRWPTESVQNSWSEEGAEKRKVGVRTAPTRHAGPATIPASMLRVGSVRRLGSPCVWDRDQIIGETNRCIVQATSKDILVRNAHFLCEDGTSWCKALQNSKNISESETSTGSRSSSITVSTGHFCIQYLQTCFASGTLGPGQAGTLMWGLERSVLLANSCGADLEDHQTYSAPCGVCIEVGPSLPWPSSEHQYLTRSY